MTRRSRLLVGSAELCLRYRRNGAEQAVRLAIGTGSEIERIGIGVSAAAQSQRPQPIDDQCLIVHVPDSAAEIPAGRVIGIDRPIAKVTDEDVAAEITKSERGPRHTPWRIQLSTSGEAFQQMAISVEHIDEAIALARYVVMFGYVLLGIGNE